MWFKTNPKYLQVIDPTNCIFLNQKAQNTAASSSEEDFVQNLQGVNKLLEQHKEKKKDKQDLPSFSSSNTTRNMIFCNDFFC
jgi:hypothetical protein